MLRANDLARLCTELVRSGNDFPTVWNTLRKGHALVLGLPRQRHDGSRNLLDISLITGERLVFDGDAKNFSITLLCGAPHKRIYAERRIMSSWRRECCSRRPIGSKSLHIFFGAACLLQHCQKLVRRLEAARLEHRGCRDGKSFQLGHRIGAQIDLGALQAGMPEPKGDLSNVLCGQQCMHCAGMTQDMWGDTLLAYGRLFARSRCDVLGEDPGAAPPKGGRSTNDPNLDRA